MLQLTWAQARGNLRRLAAAGLAILIGAAFVTATLLTSDVITRTTHAAMVVSLAEADLVVTEAWFSEADRAAIAAVPGVAVADGPSQGYVEVSDGGRSLFQPFTTAPSDPRLEPFTYTAGAPPGPGELAVTRSTADVLRLGVGDELVATDAGHQVPLRVSGIVAGGGGAFGATSSLVVHPDDARRWAGAGGAGEVEYPEVLVLLEPGADPEVVRAAVGEAVGTQDASPVVRTRSEEAEVQLSRSAGAANALTAVVLGFAAIALIVASLVIANTFAVLVAQRTHQLALLRCVGATTRQLRRSVTTEAAALGVAASLAGIVVGVALAQLALTVLGRLAPDVPLPTWVALSPAVVLVPLLAGVVVTIVAARAPSRAAARVSPLAALRPAEGPDPLAVSRRRRRLATLLTSGGFALLAGGVVLTTTGGPLLGLGVGILGGLLSFVGVLVGSVLWVPRLLAAGGTLLARRAGPTALLAAANTSRNPRRTAATSAALLIGVTLVSMMSTGAATARSSLDGELDRTYPVDLEVATVDGGAATTLGPDRVAAVAALAEVERAVPLARDAVTITTADDGLSVDVLGVDLAEVPGVVRDRAVLAGLGDETVVVPARLAAVVGIEDGTPVTITTDAAEASAPEVAVTARVTDLPGVEALVSAHTMDAITSEPSGAVIWVRLQDTATAGQVADDLQEILADRSVRVAGAALERAEIDAMIDALLGVVVALLGVAVVISLVGVANTLSLSVIERRRESATLRAIGLTRRQLRGTLAIEGMLLAGVGAVLGTGLGTLYGWAGAHTVMGAMTEGVTLGVAWRDLVVVVVVAVAAGLVASVLPARGAARIAPAAALAVE